MPASILDLAKSQERTLTLVHDGDGYRLATKEDTPDETSLSITYRPAAVTVAFAKEYEAQVAEDVLTANARWLARVVQRWDLTGDGDEPYPVSEDALLALGVDVLAMLLTAVVEDSGLGKAVESAPANGQGSFDG